MEYPVMKDGKQKGTVIVAESGLYMEIICRCRNLGEGFHRLNMVCQDQKLVLGLLVLENGEFYTKKKIQKKLMGTGTPEFKIVSESEKPVDFSIRLLQGEPVEKLETIRLWSGCIRNSEFYVYLNSQGREASPDPRT